MVRLFQMINYFSYSDSFEETILFEIHLSAKNISLVKKQKAF